MAIMLTRCIYYLPYICCKVGSCIKTFTPTVLSRKKNFTSLFFVNKNHFQYWVRWKHTIDKSRVPVIKEEDIEEQFVRGQGPGGQSVNMTSNCVVLKHIPTGMVVKCHQSRLLHENRRISRELLQNKLDILYNGEMSVVSQRKRIETEKSAKRKLKAQKLREKKKLFKERENLD